MNIAAMDRLPPLRPRLEFHHPPQAPGLRHIGYDVFTDARPAGLATHAHPGAFEVCWIRRGSLRWQGGGGTWAVGPGDLFLTLPGEPHGGRNGVMERCELFWVSFTLAGGGAGLGLCRDECRRLGGGLAAAVRRTCPGPPAIAGHFTRILSELSAPGPLAAAVVRACCALLLTDVAAAYAREEVVRACSEPIEQAKEWMRARLDTPVAIAQAAVAAGLRPSRFRERFRAETGFSPQEHLLQLRIARARELLLDGGRSITAVAFACGFSSSQHFATAFRRLTGFAPRDWRAQHR